MNFIYLNARNLSNLFSAFLSISIIVRYAGEEVYASAVLIFSLTVLLQQFGNLIVDSGLRKIMKSNSPSVASPNNSDRLTYIVTALKFILFLCLTASFVTLLFYLVKFIITDVDLLIFSLLFIFSTCCNLIASLFRTSGFVKNDFAKQTIAHILSKVLFIVLLLIIVLVFDGSLPIIGLAYVGSSIFLMVRMYYVFKVEIDLFQFKHIFQVHAKWKALLNDIGLMGLIYVGTFVASSSLIIVGNIFIQDDKLLVLLALLTSVGSMSLQFLTTFSYVVLRSIYNNDNAEDKIKIVHATNFLQFSLITSLMLCLVINGHLVFSLWLGLELESESLFVISLGILLYGLNGFTIQWSHFASATDTLRHYSLLTIAESVISLTFVSIFLYLYPDIFGITLAAAVVVLVFFFKLRVFQVVENIKSNLLECIRRYKILWIANFCFLLLWAFSESINEFISIAMSAGIILIMTKSALVPRTKDST